MSEKTDFKKFLDNYRARQGEFRVIDVPAIQYLMIDGHGDPNTPVSLDPASSVSLDPASSVSLDPASSVSLDPASSVSLSLSKGPQPQSVKPTFSEALEALYPVAYKLKFASKELGRDYVVPPLEGLWWADDMDVFTTARDKSQWDWTMMLMVPDWLDSDAFKVAVEKVGSKTHPARLEDVRLETLTEGLCVQTLHVGSFDDEGPVLERMHDEFIPANGLTLRGKHHEIYLSDFRRTPPAKLRTILRQPAANAS